MESTTLILLAVVFAAFGAAAGYFGRRYQGIRQGNSVEEDLKRKLDQAETKAKEIVLEAKEKASVILDEVKNEEKERKSQIGAMEARLISREETLDKKFAVIDGQEAALRGREESLNSKESQLAEVQNKAIAELERVSGLTSDAAREELFQKIRERNSEDLAQMLQKIDKERRDEIEKKALDIITIALQRFARSHVAEATTSLFPLGDEELKGKIIGREGRNIRALERATGVEFVIDETPDAIVISSFDPYRREVARLALGRLIKDGRIQPAKIEEKVEEARQELNKRVPAC